MTEQAPEPGPMVKVARDLSAIERLHEALDAQAVHKANDRLLPGGLAMVALGGAGSRAAQEAYVERLEAEWWNDPDTTHADRPTFPHLSDEDDSWEPPLQTLLFWSEDVRARYGYPLEGRKATVATEAAFLRWALDGMWRDEPKWADFADDIATAKRRLENVLVAGVRSERGVPCLYDACKGARLVRKLVPARAEDGSKTWRLSDWHCPKCHRSWDEDAYRRMVTAAHVAAEEEFIDGEQWVTEHRAAREVGRSVNTVRSWVKRGQVAVACIIRGRRTKFVRLADVEQRHRDGRDGASSGRIAS